MLSQDYAVTMACDVLGCARSSYYHRATDRPDEVELKAAIKTVAAEWPPTAIVVSRRSCAVRIGLSTTNVCNV